jgi:branched-chain amino acid aminotransferase
MKVSTFKTKTQLTKNSRLPQVNWDQLPFGKLFSDHMFSMDYINGQWTNFTCSEYGNISLSPAISALHYGQSCFEGMKAHRNLNNNIVLFRPYENAKRFNHSNSRMCMPEINIDLFVDAISELISIDNEWVPKNSNHSLYIRPFIFATDPYIGIRPSDSYKFMIFTCPVGDYYNEPVSVKIETEFSRAVEGGTGSAKAAGNYAAALYPAMLASEQGFRQLIWTDAKEHKYIEEAGTMNMMIVIDGTLCTAPLTSTILPGVTRNSFLTLAKEAGYPVEERRISVDELIIAQKAGTLNEVFGVGTAATIAQVEKLTFENETFQLTDIASREISNKVGKQLLEIKNGKAPDSHYWNMSVS